MASTINAKSTGSGSVETTADASGQLALQANGSTIATISSTGLAVTGTLSATGAITSGSTVVSPYTMKNRIINGAMLIDQRLVGTVVTPTNNQYTLDRWAAEVTQASKFTVQQVSGNANTTQGYQQSLRVTSSSAYSSLSTDVFDIKQQIEGYNIADFAWGTSGAKTVTLSFWVYSSLTGTFGGSITNDGTYSYAFSYTISSASTWTQVSVTIPGPTVGTWNSTTGTGLYVRFNLGCGSNYLGAANTWLASNTVAPTGSTSVVAVSGATWYITGVQLEVGSSATSFEWRPYTTELQLCQRYYEKCFSQNYKPANGFSSDVVWQAGTGAWIAYTTGSPGSIRFNAVPFAVVKRTAPTMTQYSASNASVAGNWCRYNAGWTDVTGFSFYVQDNCWSAAAAAAVTANNSYLSSGGWTADAEL